jgi:hypothetical protein
MASTGSNRDGDNTTLAAFRPGDSSTPHTCVSTVPTAGPDRRTIALADHPGAEAIATIVSPVGMDY